MKKLLGLALIATLGLSGCASVPMVSDADTSAAKEFKAPISSDNAGIYVYRVDSAIGAALKKDVFINDECVGETAPGIFFYHEVLAGKGTKVSTESEFSPNDLLIDTEQGKLYFVEQYIKMGAFVGGAGVELADEATGKAEVQKLNMAVKGSCSAK
ncbi:hypothetical protein BCT30_15675 [Enterovibrio norvegicus]|uniref:DUF2846 domain-containing protein n=2 Tax=Enterovibrio norvegicus TaxID=188144 RepID=A0A1I5KU64_9GAMM|nr:DUF2846 domain-containing protein [Enterovibrio norvegicus]MCC4800283.1 DUF2846 domain-containing protein [Enterovibrio norvegicus]OEE43370.1 hypothetical protein A1OS_10935 [Enterovibrio norvegicus]OEF56542.1 hypothetical protein A1OU_17455 [Enterovibrio norvegicus]OEF64239.1 hypothetical protein A1OW_17675 [Enterovibrio norvegicus]PMH65084.1 hypothetical protein BCU62_13790 [Enterovibrio norvegicus]